MQDRRCVPVRGLKSWLLIAAISVPTTAPAQSLPQGCRVLPSDRFPPPVVCDPGLAQPSPPAAQPSPGQAVFDAYRLLLNPYGLSLEQIGRDGYPAQPPSGPPVFPDFR